MLTDRQHLALYSVPRSGSTWLGEIFNSHPAVRYAFQPLFSYALKDYLGAEPTPDRAKAFFHELETCNDDFVGQVEARSRGIKPDFDKRAVTHLVYKEVRYLNGIAGLMRADPALKLVALVRSPLAVLASWRAAPKEFDPAWNFRAEWRGAPSKNQGRAEEFFGFDQWLASAHMFQTVAAMHPSRVRIVRYADLLRSPMDTARALFQFAGLEMDPQTVGFLSESQDRHPMDPYSVFRSKRADLAWQNGLEADIVDTVIQETTAAGLQEFLDHAD